MFSAGPARTPPCSPSPARPNAPARGHTAGPRSHAWRNRARRSTRSRDLASPACREPPQHRSGPAHRAGRGACSTQRHVRPLLPHGRFHGDDPQHAPALADGCGLLNAAGRGLHARAGHGHRRVMQVLVIIVQNGVPHSELGRQPFATTPATFRLRPALGRKSPLNHYQLVISVHPRVHRGCQALPARSG